VKTQKAGKLAPMVGKELTYLEYHSYQSFKKQNKKKTDQYIYIYAFGRRFHPKQLALHLWIVTNMILNKSNWSQNIQKNMTPQNINIVYFTFLTTRILLQ